MLLRDNPKLIARTARIKLSQADWKRFEALEAAAKSADKSLDLELALAESLLRMISRSERLLYKNTERAPTVESKNKA